MWGWRKGIYLYESTDADPLRVSAYLSDYYANTETTPFYDQKQKLLNVYRAMADEYQPETSRGERLLKFEYYGKIARLYFRIGKMAIAEECFMYQLDLAGQLDIMRILPEVHNNLGMIHEETGALDEALRYFQRAHEIAEEHLRGANHPAKAIILSNLGNLEGAMGDPMAAFLKCRQALRIIENRLGMRHIGLIPMLLKLARAQRDRGHFDEALDQSRRALQVVEKRLDIEHPYVSSILQTLGLIYFYQQKYDTAQRYLYRTMEITERALGPEHPYVGVQMHYIGLIHAYTGNAGGAEKYFMWALEIRRTALGDDDLTVGLIYRDIAILYEAEGRPEARSYREKAMAILTRKLPPNHPQLADIPEQERLDPIDVDALTPPVNGTHSPEDVPAANPLENGPPEDPPAAGSSDVDIDLPSRDEDFPA